MSDKSKPSQAGSPSTKVSKEFATIDAGVVQLQLAFRQQLQNFLQGNLGNKLSPELLTGLNLNLETATAEWTKLAAKEGFFNVNFTTTKK